MHRKIIPAVLFIIISVVINACANLDTTQEDQSKPVWPSPPAAARIAFEQSFSTPAELGINKGFWQWLGEFIFGAEDSRMIRPMAVITVGDRLIYVADPGVRGVHRFNTHDHSYHLIQGKDGSVLPSPVAMTTDADGNVYVTDSELAQVLVIHEDSDHAESLLLDEPLQQPTGLAIDSNSGDLYLIDTRQHQVLIFNSQGNLKQRFGQRGTQAGEFNYPTLIWQSGTTILVNDSLNFRIQSFDLDGNFLSEFGKAGQSSGYQSRPKGIAMDQAGHIYVVDALLNNIQLFDGDGQYLLTIGERGQQAGQFWLPAGIFISPEQKIYVADSHNQRVQVFRYIGKQQ